MTTPRDSALFDLVSPTGPSRFGLPSAGERRAANFGAFGAAVGVLVSILLIGGLVWSAATGQAPPSRHPTIFGGSLVLDDYRPLTVIDLATGAVTVQLEGVYAQVGATSYGEVEAVPTSTGKKWHKRRKPRGRRRRPTSMRSRRAGANCKRRTIRASTTSFAPLSRATRGLRLSCSNGCAPTGTCTKASTRAGTAPTTRPFGPRANSSTAAVRTRNAAGRWSGSPSATGSSACRPTATGCSRTSAPTPISCVRKRATTR